MLTQGRRKALLIAWNLLASESAISICAALYRVFNTHRELQDDVSYLVNYIQDSLETHFDLEQWQISNGFGFRSVTQLRKDRIAWIQWMLEEESC